MRWWTHSSSRYNRAHNRFSRISSNKRSKLWCRNYPAKSRKSSLVRVGRRLSEFRRNQSSVYVFIWKQFPVYGKQLFEKLLNYVFAHKQVPFSNFERASANIFVLPWFSSREKRERYYVTCSPYFFSGKNLPGMPIDNPEILRYFFDWISNWKKWWVSSVILMTKLYGFY